MPTKKIADGIRRYRKEVHAQHQQLFSGLAAGQHPEVLLITCSDSRIDPALITQTLPGDLFVVRNAGNLVGTYGPEGDAQAGTIEYAVKALGVRHIVVCGHAHCGAMAAVLDPASVESLPAVAAWLKSAGPERAPGADVTLDKQVRFNVIRQLEQLRTHPAVREAEAGGKLKLHGWVYDFESGEIVKLDSESGEFLPIVAAGRDAAA
jgi:carbonic anhydrase